MDTTEENGRFVLVASREELKRWADYGDVSREGIIFAYELAGPEGANFFLFPARHHTKEDIENTKNWLRAHRDVVHIFIGKARGRYPLPKRPPVWTPEQREAGFRQIVSDKAFARVEDCVTVDLFTASAVVAVLDRLNPQNKEKLLQYRASTIIKVVWKLVS